MDLKSIIEAYRAEISKLCESEYVYYAFLLLLVVVTTYGLLSYMEYRMRKILRELKTESLKNQDKTEDIRDRVKDLEGREM
jgi:hypothetical protein